MALSPVELSHTLVQQTVRPAETAVDATAGNGRDTVLLAQLVGPAGRVIAFDTQKAALENTRKNLEQQGLDQRVTLVHRGHQHLGDRVAIPVAAVMFNLGYLPGGDHSFTTAAETTLPGLNQALELLRPGGIVTVVGYPGHPGGEHEVEAVEAWAADLPRPRFSVWRWHCLNPRGKPPRLVAVSASSRQRIGPRGVQDV